MRYRANAELTERKHTRKKGPDPSAKTVFAIFPAPHPQPPVNRIQTIAAQNDDPGRRRPGIYLYSFTSYHCVPTSRLALEALSTAGSCTEICRCPSTGQIIIKFESARSVPRPSSSSRSRWKEEGGRKEGGKRKEEGRKEERGRRKEGRKDGKYLPQRNRKLRNLKIHRRIKRTMFPVHRWKEVIADVLRGGGGLGQTSGLSGTPLRST
ncbi:hypothetical protein PUN28_007913 [Cardiocondyla obscurior]|uniref:Uncharacterized protein n=1 Tax=Cardiocondyla obscurior TaxID=286306 RepID=A0AAW2G0B5_9HYME